MRSIWRKGFKLRDMLDLELLEKQLDEALASETNDSLEDWLNSKRNSYVENHFSQGLTREMEKISFSSVQSVGSIIKYSTSNELLVPAGIREFKNAA